MQSTAAIEIWILQNGMVWHGMVFSVALLRYKHAHLYIVCYVVMLIEFFRKLQFNIFPLAFASCFSLSTVECASTQFLFWQFVYYYFSFGMQFIWSHFFYPLSTILNLHFFDCVCLFTVFFLQQCQLNSWIQNYKSAQYFSLPRSSLKWTCHAISYGC